MESAYQGSGIKETVGRIELAQPGVRRYDCGRAACALHQLHLLVELTDYILDPPARADAVRVALVIAQTGIGQPLTGVEAIDDDGKREELLLLPPDPMEALVAARQRQLEHLLVQQIDGLGDSDLSSAMRDMLREIVDLPWVELANTAALVDRERYRHHPYREFSRRRADLWRRFFKKGDETALAMLMLETQRRELRPPAASHHEGR